MLFLGDIIEDSLNNTFKMTFRRGRDRKRETRGGKYFHNALVQAKISVTVLLFH